MALEARVANLLRHTRPARRSDLECETASRTIRSDRRSSLMDGQLLPSARIKSLAYRTRVSTQYLGTVAGTLGFRARDLELVPAGPAGCELERASALQTPITNFLNGSASAGCCPCRRSDRSLVLAAAH